EDANGSQSFEAPLIIGADGMRSMVARIGAEKIGAFERTDTRCSRAYYYAYFEGVARARLGDDLVTEFESRRGAGNLMCRCNNDLVVAATAFDCTELNEFRADLKSNFAAGLRDSFAVSEALEGARMIGKIRSSGLLLNTWRNPVANGAILLGDAGL